MRAILLALLASACIAQDGPPDGLIKSGHWKRARALVERRLLEAPDDPQALFLLSQIRNAFGDRNSPPELAERAVRLDGREARYHRQLAEVQGLIAQHAGAIQQLLLARRFRKEIDTALLLDPHDTQAIRDLMEFYLVAPGIAGGDPKKADALARRILAIDAAEGFLAQARIAAFKQDQRGTESQLRRAADVRPPSYAARMALADVFLAAGHRKEGDAEDLAHQALALDDGRVDAYRVLAVVYAGRGEWRTLEATLAAARQKVPDDYAPYYRAAERILADGADAARAEQYLRTYLSQEREGNQPTAADAHWKLGVAMQAQGRDALQEWKLAAQLDNESPAVRELKRPRNAGEAGKSKTVRAGGVH